MHLGTGQAASGKQPLRGCQLAELLQGVVVEAVEVTVDGVEGRHHSAGQPDEHRVCRRAFQSEDPRLASDEQVEQEPKLGSHWVDHALCGLEVGEQGPQLAVDARIAQECAEHHESRDGSQRRVGAAELDIPRVRTLNAPGSVIAISPLATREVSPHLPGASGVLSRLSHDSTRRTHPARYSPHFESL